MLGTALSQLPTPEGPIRSILFTGSAEGARSLLSTVAGAMITTIGVIFSLTVLALQMAAGQHSPRVMRNFLRDAERTIMGTIGSVYGPRGNERTGSAMPEVPDAALAVPALRTGYVQAASPEDVAGWARDHDVVVRFRPTIGEHLVDGAVLAWVWRRRKRTWPISLSLPRSWRRRWTASPARSRPVPGRQTQEAGSVSLPASFHAPMPPSRCATSL